jgi:hypothetical protein
LYPVDDDRVVRRLPRSWLNRDDEDRRNTNTFARAVAWQYCRTHACHDHGDADEVHLIYGNQPTAALYSVRDVADCRRPPSDTRQWVACTEWVVKDDDATRSLTGKVVLLGGTYADSEDFHPTPAGERTPGLVINAWGVRAEVEGPTLVESSRLFGLGFDVLMLIVPAVGLSVVLFYMGKLWLTWVVMLVSSLAWNIVLENVDHHEESRPAVRRRRTPRPTRRWRHPARFPRHRRSWP